MKGGWGHETRKETEALIAARKASDAPAVGSVVNGMLAAVLAGKVEAWVSDREIEALAGDRLPARAVAHCCALCPDMTSRLVRLAA